MNVTNENPDMNVPDMNITDENSEHSDDSIEIENDTTSSIILRKDESELETTIVEAQSQPIDEIHPHQNNANIQSDSVDISQSDTEPKLINTVDTEDTSSHNDHQHPSLGTPPPSQKQPVTRLSTPNLNDSPQWKDISLSQILSSQQLNDTAPTQVFNDSIPNSAVPNDITQRTPRRLPKTPVQMADSELSVMKRQIAEIEKQVEHIPEIRIFMERQNAGLLNKVNELRMYDKMHTVDNRLKSKSMRYE